MQATERVTGKDIILDIVENMRSYREELLYSSVVPSSFEVHLHPDDYARLEGIFPTIATEARRALDEELVRQNRRAGPDWLRRFTGTGSPTQPAQEGWNITFFRDENDELSPGDLLIDSRLTLPQVPELGSGTRTRRITTSRIGQQVSTRTQVLETAPAPPPPLPDSSAMVPSPPPVPPTVPSPAAAAEPGTDDATVKTSKPVVFATLSYEDKSGQHTHAVTTPQVVIGRGGAGYWVDIRIEGTQDVSREHVRLRRDMTTGQFFLKDVSLFGTTVNGERVASSLDSSDGAKRDLNVEVELPPVARIGLADMVFLEFRRADVR
jgi:hypothetical protein